jgi:hypothetical protein
MTQHAFTVYVAGINPDNPHYEDALYSAGCTDALIVVRHGHLMLDFDRDAPTYDLAVQSATRAVEQAGGRVLGVDPITD